MEKTKEVETTEENPFEVTEQSECQKVIGSDDGTHKCDTCSLDFATCESISVQFGYDLYPEATGKEADRVISCRNFISRHNLADVVAFSPSPFERVL